MSRLNRLFGVDLDVYEHYRGDESRSVMWLCAITISAVTPFSIYRFYQGEWFVGVIDLMVTVMASSLLFFVWKTHRPEKPTLVYSLACLGIAYGTVEINGPSLAFWGFPAITTVFYLLHHRIAVFLNGFFFLVMANYLWRNTEIFEFTTIVVTLLSTFAISYVFASSRYRQRLDAYYLAVQDPLTQVGNRRALNSKLEELASLNQRYQIPASLILLDFDHFKKINDSYGHDVGDEMLKALAELITSQIRVNDSLYRFGGEEFIVVVESTALEEARLLAEKVRSSIESNSFLDGIKITASAGVSEYQQDEGVNHWIKRADRALYRAKDSGRNRVVCNTEDGEC